MDSFSTSKPGLTVVLLGGEGIGPEVVGAAALILERVAPALLLETPVHGQEALAESGSPLPEATRQRCREADAILFGATLEHSRSVLRFLRWGLDTYANLRPTKTRRGLPSALASREPVDLLIVRENLEGEYPSREGEVAELTRRWPELRDKLDRPLGTDGTFAIRVITEAGSRRVAKVAVRAAIARQREGRPAEVAVVTKANVLRRSDGLFWETARQEIEAAGLRHRHLFVDDACRRLLAEPESFGVILAPNLYGDVMSDIAAELAGGLGMAPSACIGDDAAYFEAVHGSAPDIAGKGVANPLATVLSAAMLLDHLDFEDEARQVEEAVESLLADGHVLPPDLGGNAGTADVTRELLERI